MPGPSVQRTIVKSPPEVWSEVSDLASLARHLGAFGEITITRVTPETAVAWEGDRARGTVTLERSGWGTKVTVTAEAVDGVAEQEAAADVTAVQEPDPEPGLDAGAEMTAAPEPAPAPRARWWQRLFGRRRQAAPEPQAQVPAQTPAPETVPEPEPAAQAPAPEPAPELPAETESVLTAMLEHIGAAHHRPFSRG